MGTTVHRDGPLSGKVKCEFRGWGESPDGEGLKGRGSLGSIAVKTGT